MVDISQRREELPYQVGPCIALEQTFGCAIQGDIDE